MSKHTPGPWKLLKFDDDEHYTVTNQEGTHGFHREIAKVSFGYSEPAETEQHANAALIAAAPDLFAALLEARLWLKEITPRTAQLERDEALIDAAIEKATDKSN